MSELVIASSEADASAAEAVRQHHAAMAGTLRLHVEGLVGAVTRQDAAGADSARRELVDWLLGELVPHAVAEEKAMYPAAQAIPEGRLLVEGMLGEHAVITGLVDQVRAATDPVRAAAYATALDAIFNAHLTKENDLVLPLLAARPDVSVADLLGGMHELLGGHEAGHEAGHDTGSSGCGGHTCSCGESDGSGYPELDARTIPHAIRHATIFGALEAVSSGAGLVLVAPHDPLPLLAQIEQRWPDRFAVDYLERGPEAWRLAFARTA